MDLVEELVAADLVPVDLQVRDGGNGLVPGLTLVGPASLGDPDILATGNANNGLVRLLEKGSGVLNGVVVTILVVGVLVNTEPVNGVNNGTVGSVGEGIPGVDVTDGDVLKSGTLELGLVVVDEADDGLGASTNTSVVANTGGTSAVQILGADGDTDHKVGEVIAEVIQTSLEGSQFVGNAGSAGSPDTEEDGGIGRDGSIESLDRVSGGTALDVGVETNGVECARSALEVLGVGELLLEVGLNLGRAITVGGT